jgi:hypothetical protein
MSYYPTVSIDSKEKKEMKDYCIYFNMRAGLVPMNKEFFEEQQLKEKTRINFQIEENRLKKDRFKFQEDSPQNVSKRLTSSIIHPSKFHENIDGVNIQDKKIQNCSCCIM